MTFWIIALRAVGTLIFLVGVLGGTINNLAYPVSEDFWWVITHIWLPVIEYLVFALLCFGAASALASLRRTEERIARATTRRRRSVQQGSGLYNPPPMSIRPVEGTQPIPDLAPVAPQWEELKLGIHPQVAEKRIARSHRMGTADITDLYDDFYNQRLIQDRQSAGYEPGPPTTRQAPPPIRETPAAGQYADPAPPPAPPRRAPPVYQEPPADLQEMRNLLRLGRDKHLRRTQAEQARKRHSL